MRIRKRTTENPGIQNQENQSDNHLLLTSPCRPLAASGGPLRAGAVRAKAPTPRASADALRLEEHHELSVRSHDSPQSLRKGSLRSQADEEETPLVSKSIPACCQRRSLGTCESAVEQHASSLADEFPRIAVDARDLLFEGLVCRSDECLAVGPLAAH